MKEYKTTGLKGLTIGKDGKVMRLEMRTTSGDVGFFLPSSALAGLIPVLVKAEADARQVSGMGGVTNVFRAQEVAVSIPADKDGLVLTLTLPQGLDGGMGFRIDIETARRLLQTLAALMPQSDEPASRAQAPATIDGARPAEHPAPLAAKVERRRAVLSVDVSEFVKSFTSASVPTLSR